MAGSAGSPRLLRRGARDARGRARGAGANGGGAAAELGTTGAGLRAKRLGGARMPGEVMGKMGKNL